MKILKLLHLKKKKKMVTISIDLGYSTLVTGCSKDKNIKITNFKQKKLFKNISDLQSLKDLKKKDSINYNKLNKTFKRKKRKLSNKQKDFQHKSSKKVIDFCLENNIGK